MAAAVAIVAAALTVAALTVAACLPTVAVVDLLAAADATRVAVESLEENSVACSAADVAANFSHEETFTIAPSAHSTLHTVLLRQLLTSAVTLDLKPASLTSPARLMDS
jgi:hypothetical protein